MFKIKTSMSSWSLEKSQKLVLEELVQTTNLYREESACAPIGISLWKMSGPETEESHGWNGIGLTRGAAVKKKKSEATQVY